MGKIRSGSERLAAGAGPTRTRANVNKNVAVARARNIDDHLLDNSPG
jgi:hypothetical protein